MCDILHFLSPRSISDRNPVVYWFDTISNLLVYDISEVVLIRRFMTKTPKELFLEEKLF